MHVEIDDAQVDALRALLDTTVRQMSHDISDTNTHSYRTMLRQRREVLQRTIDAIGGALTDVE